MQAVAHIVDLDGIGCAIAKEVKIEHFGLDLFGQSRTSATDEEE